MSSRPVTLLWLGAVFVAGAAVAQPCDVVANNATHYTSLTSALAALPDRDGNRLDVSGVCQERVTVLSHVDLTIEGHNGAVLEPSPSSPGSQPQTLNIRTSDRIEVRNLIIRGKANVHGAVSVIDSRTVTFTASTIENGGGSEGGAWIVRSMNVALQNVTIQNNSNGIRVDGPAQAVLVGFWGPNPQGTAYVQNNNTGAVLNSGAILSLRGDAVVRNNNVGVNGIGGSLVVCCFQDAAHPRIEDNAYYGVFMRGGDLQVQSQLVVQRNGSYGLAMIGTQGRLWDCFVRENGTGPSGGLGVISVGGLVDVLRAEITANHDGGMVVTDGGTLRLQGSKVTGNQGFGIDVQQLSALFVSGTQVQDNRGFDVRCAPNSAARGDESTIGRLQCPGFGHAPDPVPGPRD